MTCSGILNSNKKCVTGYSHNSDTTEPGPGVIFAYTEPDYKGCKATRWVGNGQTIEQSPAAMVSENCESNEGAYVMLQDDPTSGTGGGISSIKLGPGTMVDLFQWRDYGGDTIRLKSSSPNLANQGFNNKAWSWRITKCPNGTFTSNDKCVTGSSSDSDTTEPGPGCFTVYTESDYKGCKATRCAYHDQGCTDNNDNNDNIPAERIGRCTRAIVSDNCVSNGGAYVMLEGDSSSGTGSGISSVKLGSGTILDVFQWRFYEGDNTKLTSSSSNLGTQNWNDKIWSWKATLDCNNNSLKNNTLCNSKTYYNTKSPPTTSDSFEPPAGCFTLYTGTDYTGCKATRCAYDNDCGLGVGKCGIMPCSDCSFSNSCEGMSDKVRSIKVSPGINVTLYEDNNLSGDRVDYRTNTSDLGNFKDKASSWMATMDCQHINLKNLSQCFNQDLIIKNLTDLEQNLLRTHLQTHWNNSPFTIFSNRKGHVFKASWPDLNKDLYNINLTPPLNRTNRFQILKQDTCGAVDKRYYCPFRGWRYPKKDQWVQRGEGGKQVTVYIDRWGDALQLNLNHVDGYNNILNNISPVIDDDFTQTNYCNSDHRVKFEENKITIKLPKQLLGGSDEYSNFIPGYYLLSYTNGINNDNTFNFLICNRGDSSIDPAFLLYHKLPFEDYYNSMLTYHQVLIKTIIISKIYPQTRNCIINNSMVENEETKKCFINSSTNMKDLVSRYYTQNYSGCNTVTDFTPFTRCSELVNINNTVLENYQSWLNNTNHRLNDDGIDLLSQYEYVNAKNFYLLNRRLCSTNDKILKNTNKNSCGYQLGPENPNQIRPPSERSLYEELYRKELYNSLAKSQCDATTPKPDICTTINESLTINNVIYPKINDIWTNKNCYGDIPKSIYTYLIEENPTLTIENNSIDSSSTTSINNFIDELKTSNDIFARKLCYSGDVLENGEVMYSTNSTLYSNSGDILLTLETNGNLVLKRKSDNTILWQTNTSTSNSIGLSILSMQNDNNLVLYPGWQSNTSNNNSKKAFLVVQDNGKLVLRYSDGTILQTINSSSMENNSSSMENNTSSMENNFSSMLNYVLILFLFIIFIILCYIFKSQIYKLWKLNG